MEVYSRVYTWMRRGTWGPRGSTTWTARGRLRGVDVTRGVIIFTIYILL